MVDIDKSSAAVSLEEGSPSKLHVAFKNGESVTPENLSKISKDEINSQVRPQLEEYLSQLKHEGKPLFNKKQVEAIGKKFLKNTEKYLDGNGQLDGDKFYADLDKEIARKTKQRTQTNGQTDPKSEQKADPEASQKLGEVKNIAKTALKNAPLIIGGLILDELLMGGRLRQGAIGSMGQAAMAAFVMSRFGGKGQSFGDSFAKMLPTIMGLGAFSSMMGGQQQSAPAAGVGK
jgi:hypothetical protein